MLSLTHIYDKRGKTQKAIYASKLVIKAYEFMVKEENLSIYLKHKKKIA